MSRNILITGANRGIGLAMAAQFKKGGDNVIAAVRSSSKELDSLDLKVVDGVDLSKTNDLERLKTALEGTQIDILVNCAGILLSDSLGSIEYQSLRQQFEINALAPIRISELLLDNLKPGSKVAFITSRMGSISDNGSGSYYGYRMSKAALNAGAVSFARDVSDKKIAVAILHPGMVSTRMINFNGDVSPEQAAEGLIARVEALDMNTSGTFWHANGEELPW